PVRPESEGRRWAWLRDGRTPSAPIAVVTRALDLDLASPLLAGAPAHARTIVITTQAAPAERRAAPARPAEGSRPRAPLVDMVAALEALAGRGYQRVLAEGGPHLLAQIAAEGLLGELCFTLSPLLADPGADRIVAGGLPMPGGGAQPFTLKHALEADGF